jgi:hypothetical protein
MPHESLVLAAGMRDLPRAEPLEAPMLRIDIVVRSAVFALLALSASAADAGDPVRGKALWLKTYHCTDCHAQTPLANVVTVGSTPAGLLGALHEGLMQPLLTTLGQNGIDLADVAAYIATSTKSAPDLDQQGLTGSWYDAPESGQGIEVEVYPDLVTAGTGLVSGAWFTFDAGTPGGADRQRWYIFSGNAVRGAASMPITIGQNIGGNFDAPPTTASTVVGTGTLTFTSCTSGSLAYTFTDGSGRSGMFPITRITPNVTCAAEPALANNADFTFSGNWYDPATSGQGFVFEVNPFVPVVFFAWYTYSPAGQSAGASGQRWYTGQGAFAPGTRTIDLTLGETIGGVFDQPTPGGQKTNAVGTATVTFTSCTSARLQFAFDGGTSVGRSGTIALTRVGPAPAGCTS